MRRLHGITRRLLSLPGWALIGLVKAYQVCLSPVLGKNCRFQPTCSQYFIESVRKYGSIRGAWRGIARICRCHPWNPGGHDPP
jgi:putative membrane protein insertion efficiency factor